MSIHLLKTSLGTGIYNAASRNFSSSAVNYAGLVWRLKNGYPANYKDRGVLTDGPDYSFLDGRSTPYTSGQRRRILLHKERSEKIMDLLKTINYAKEQYRMKQQEKQREIDNILARKLKPKGSRSGRRHT